MSAETALAPAAPSNTSPSARGSIEGIVLSATKEPIADALVAAVPELSGSTEEETRSAGFTRTSRDGRFRLDHLAPGAYAVTATMSGHAAAFVGGLRLQANSALRQVQLIAPVEGMVLGGTIRATSGEAIPGAELRAVRYSDFKGDVFYVHADSAGSFTIQVPRAMYLLIAVAPGRETVVRPRVPEATQTLSFGLAPSYPPGPAPDSVVGWFRRTGIPLKTVQAEQGLSDMRALDRVVGDARVVALGEATHGTREFFQLKHRMLEYLVRERGFTVFGIEASMPEAFQVNDYVLHGRGDPAKALTGLYFWTWDTEEVLEMIHWMRRYNEDPLHRRKVKFYGFDMQFAPRAVKTVVAYLRRVAPAEGDNAARSLAPLADGYVAQRFAGLPAERKAEVESALAQIVKRLDARRVEFARETGEEAWALARQHARIAAQFVDMIQGRQQARDRAMAENIAWILEREGAQSRMVVWAHNLHVATFEGEGMGAELRRLLGKRMVVFGFAFARGSFQAIPVRTGRPGNLTSFTVGGPPEGSLDETLSRTGHAIAAFDLRQAPPRGPIAEWLTARHATRDVGSVYNDSLASGFFMRPVAREDFDAILFVERTTAARPSRFRPPSPATEQDTISNLGFEAGAVGAHPPGWVFSGSTRATFYRAETSREDPREGSRCAVIRALPGNRYAEWAGTLSKNVDVAPYRGTNVRLRAAVRLKTNDPDCRARLWLRGSKPSSGVGPASDAIYAEPKEGAIRSSEWRDLEITAKVPDEAVTLGFGLSLVGEGTAYLDSVSLEPADR